MLLDLLQFSCKIRSHVILGYFYVKSFGCPHFDLFAQMRNQRPIQNCSVSSPCLLYASDAFWLLSDAIYRNFIAKICIQVADMNFFLALRSHL